MAEGRLSVLFISHARADDDRVRKLEAWLRLNGFTDLFVDHTSIAGGEKWREALRASAASCRVLLCLVTKDWLASPECFNEFRAAWYMGKRIIPLLLLSKHGPLDPGSEKRLAEVLAEDQGIDIERAEASDGAIDFDVDDELADRLRKALRAAGALNRVGLDPEAFEIDRSLRPTPFPGLASFSDDDADAALFYGRSREIAASLEILRSMRALSERGPLVILGASGAGKSSLLKGGIIPRLRREAPAWLPLRAFRPGADPLLNFAETLTRTLADFGRGEAHGNVRDELLKAWRLAERNPDGTFTEAGSNALGATLQTFGHKLRAAAGRPAASILVSVDQAEELASGAGDSADALADYLRAALANKEDSWQLAFTIRTDSFAELQGHQRFQNLEARGYDLRALPAFRFSDVIEAPAKRYNVEIDPAMIDALMEDAPKNDALPLLAFAMQRLWRQYASSSALTLANYQAVGGIMGLIEDAGERAMRGIEPDQDVPIPSTPLSERLDELGSAIFLPSLVQVNEEGAAIRCVAQWQAFPEEQQDLLKRFDRWRLVVRRGTETDGGTVEVAHEALFRKWTRLSLWIEKEERYLELQRQLRTDHERYAGAERKKKRDFLLGGTRLKEARQALRNRPAYFNAFKNFIEISRVSGRRRLAGWLLVFSPALLWIIWILAIAVSALVIFLIGQFVELPQPIGLDKTYPTFYTVLIAAVFGLPYLAFLAFIFFLEFTASKIRHAHWHPLVRFAANTGFVISGILWPVLVFAGAAMGVIGFPDVVRRLYSLYLDAL
jgi:hypothetical protein